MDKIPRNLLLIDDDRELCAEFKDIFESEGYNVTTTHDGITGKELLEKGSFDILLLDIKLPGMNGFGILRWLKERKSRVHTIVLTGRPLHRAGQFVKGGDEEEELLNYADAVINKPSKIEIIIDKINSLT